MRFSGKTVVITGAASGIGRDATLLFAREGAAVYAADIDSKGGMALAAHADGAIRFQQCDVTSTESIRALMDRAASETGGIDVLFNNAGAGGARAKIHEIEPADWDRTMDLHSDFWQGRGDLYYALRQSLVEGILAGTDYTMVSLADGQYEIVKKAA